MKKLFFLSIIIFQAHILFSQTADTILKKKPAKIDLSNRANDHFMMQYGIDGWSGSHDTASPSGFSRHFNFYLMVDKPFKANAHFSLGFGFGLGSSNMFFKDTYINLKSLSTTLPFTDVEATNHFAKFKLTTIFAQVPLEFRYSGNPAEPEKGFKFAVGAKIGELLKAYTKGKNLENSSAQSIYGPTYIEKESDKRFINTTAFAVTGRIGYGILSLDGSYEVTSFLKTGTGPVIHPFSIGITLSGL